jgi:hypothetical protein
MNCDMERDCDWESDCDRDSWSVGWETDNNCDSGSGGGDWIAQFAAGLGTGSEKIDAGRLDS